MNTDRFKQRLLEKEQDLLESIARLDSAGRDARAAEVEDPIDQVTSSELKAGAFAVSTVEARTLEQVRAAFVQVLPGAGSRARSDAPFPSRRCRAV